MLTDKDFNKTSTILISSLLSVLFFVYILLFEFVLPINKILPKPSILLASIPSLVEDYNFGFALVRTVSTVFISLFVSYFLIKFFNRSLLFAINLFPKVLYLKKVSEYFIPFFLILLLALWFNKSIWFEFLFALVLVMSKLKFSFFGAVSSLKQEYIESSKSLGISQQLIQDKIIWKLIQPKLFESINEYYKYLWAWVLVYEFVLNSDGVGSVLNLAIKYNDLSVVVLSIIILIIVNILGTFLLKSIKRKFFFWEE